MTAIWGGQGLYWSSCVCRVVGSIVWVARARSEGPPRPSDSRGVMVLCGLAKQRPRWTDRSTNCSTYGCLTYQPFDLQSHALHPSYKTKTKQAPLWSLVALGAYALGNIGWNLMRFNSCPEAAEELQKVSPSRRVNER